MQLLTGSEAQIDLFGHDPDLPMFKQETKRVRNTKSSKRNKNCNSNSVTLPNGKATIVNAENGITVRHHKASCTLPEHLLMLNHEYDSKADDLVINWTDEDIHDLWDGILNEHLKMLRQTKPGSTGRMEILKWQESESFKDLCAAVAYSPDDIRDGVLLALNNYDFISQTREIVSSLTSLDNNVIELVAKSGLPRREFNSRQFKDQLADWFLSQFRKARNSKAKWEKIYNLMQSDELKNLSNEIGLDISGVINRTKPKLYFIQNPSDEDYSI